VPGDELLSDAAGSWSAQAGEHFHALCQATYLVHTERDERLLFEGLLDVLQESLRADHLYLFVRDEGSGAIVPKALRQKSTGAGVPVSRTILKRVITENRAVLTPDARKDERFRMGDSIVLHKIGAVVCVPVAGAGRPFGALYVVNSETPERFDAVDLELLASIGAQLGSRLEHQSALLARQRDLVALAECYVALAPLPPPHSAEHARRVGTYAAATAREMGLAEDEALRVRLAGLLHDVVRSAHAVPAAAHASLHGLPGFEDILGPLRALREHYDGTGTPDGRKGEAIPFAARVVAVAEAFDVLAHRAPGEGKDAPEANLLRQVFVALEKEAGQAFDPAVVRALVVAHRHGTLFLRARMPEVLKAEVALPAEAGGKPDSTAASPTAVTGRQKPPSLPDGAVPTSGPTRPTKGADGD